MQQPMLDVSKTGRKYQNVSRARMSIKACLQQMACNVGCGPCIQEEKKVDLKPPIGTTSIFDHHLITSATAHRRHWSEEDG